MALRYSTAALAAFASVASAQTYSSCNPMEKSCPPNPAIEENFYTDFRSGQGALQGWSTIAGKPEFEGDGAHFVIRQQGQSTTIQTNGYFMYGRMEVRTKAANGIGIVSSIVMQSDSLDEIDWEFLSSSPNEVQTNYFGKGNTTTYDRMIRQPVDNAQANMHTYSVDWNAERIEFWIDTTRVRVLDRAAANGGANYPQTPMNARIGIWAGGDPNNGEGTIAWAGGLTDFSQAPFTQILESVKITNYSPGKEYKWNDKSGNSDSIEVVGGSAPQKPANADPSPAPAPAPSSEAPKSDPTSAPASTLATSVQSSSAPAESTPSSSAARPGNPNSPGGLGGGNGGVTQAASVAPSATKAVDCGSNPSDSLCATASIPTPHSAAPTNSNNGGDNSQTPPNAGSKVSAFGGAAVAAVMVALLG